MLLPILLTFFIFSKCVSVVWFDISISRRCEVIPRIAGHCWSTLCPYPWSRNIQTTKRYFHVTCEDWEVIVEVHFALTLGHRTYKTHKNIFMLLVLRLQINGGINTYMYMYTKKNIARVANAVLVTLWLPLTINVIISVYQIVRNSQLCH